MQNKTKVLCKQSIIAFDLLKQFKNGHHNVIHIAESRGFKLLSVMEPSSPVDGYVTHLWGREGEGGVRGEGEDVIFLPHC